MIKPKALLAFPLLFLLALSLSSSARTAPGSKSKHLTLAQVWDLNTTYRDSAHGVTFRYPSVWRQSSHFGYHPPALKDSFAPPIVGLAYDVDGFPRPHAEDGQPYSSTNLEGFGIVYSAIEAPSAARCDKMAASLGDLPTRRTFVVAARSFSVYETGEAGMSQSISGHLYATYAGHTCYLFETDMAMASVGALDDITALTKTQERFIDGHLLRIVRTVRITPH